MFDRNVPRSPNINEAEKSYCVCVYACYCGMSYMARKCVSYRNTHTNRYFAKNVYNEKKRENLLKKTSLLWLQRNFIEPFVELVILNWRLMVTRCKHQREKQYVCVSSWNCFSINSHENSKRLKETTKERTMRKLWRKSLCACTAQQ